MPKSQIVEPQKERKTGKLTCPDIPLNQYSGTVEDELERYGPEALIGIYEEMFLIREFENMLQEIKTHRIRSQGPRALVHRARSRSRRSGFSAGA